MGEFINDGVLIFKNLRNPFPEFRVLAIRTASKLKVGDGVCFGRNTHTKEGDSAYGVVSRLTPKQIVVRAENQPNWHYWKHNGKRVGDSRMPIELSWYVRLFCEAVESNGEIK